ncbi:AAA family ATPase [Knoellia sp. CPCC 206435]|uniref:AAA family ATPase n=1 Tax=Knoellia terrae TaxID=3404797 RepID=UPI003B4368BF
MTLRDYAAVVRRKWPVIVACALMAAVVVWLLTPATPPEPKPESYSATATLLVSSPPQIGDEPVPQVSLGRIALYVKTGEVPVRAAQRLDYAGDPAVLASQIKVIEDEAALALEISSTGTEATRVATVVNAFAAESVAFFGRDRPGSGGAKLAILQQATPIADGEGPSYVLPPGRWARTVLGGLVGLLLGFALALVLHQFDSRLRTRDEVYAAMGLPIIAEVPRLNRSKRSPHEVIVTSEPLSPYADAYRAARAAVMYSLAQSEATRAEPQPGVPGRGPAASAVLVTSGHATEGKTTTVVNLAASFVEAGKRVLVLDGDLRSPDTHVRFDVPQGAGISDYLLDPMGTSLEALVRPTSIPNVGIITAGTSLANPTALVSRMGTLIAEARHLCDVLIVDSAPLLDASDVFDILPMVDTVLVVVRSGRLTESAAQRVAELLRRFQVPVTGVALVGVPRRRSAGYGYGYGQDENRGEASGSEDSVTRRTRRAAQR